MSVLQSLKWIFWGALIVAVALQLNGVDLLNNTLGYAVIAVGMIGLVKNPLGGRHSTLMKLIAIVVLLDAFWAPFAEGRNRLPNLEKTATIVLDILNVLAAIGFGIVMQRLCGKIPLQRAEHTWRKNIALWCIGVPATVSGTLLSFWAVHNENGAISPELTPRHLMIPLFVLYIITVIVWLHFLVSLWQTIAGLKGMVKKLPSADAFGLDRASSFHFQFSIRALMIVTAAVAVIAAGVSQATILYWQLTMAGLIGLSLAAIWLDHRTLSKGLLIAVAAILVAGYTQLSSHGQFGPVCGTNAFSGYYDADYQLSDSFLADIDRWLVSKGYEKSPPPGTNSHLFERFSSYKDLPFAPEPKAAVWYRGSTSHSQGVTIRVLYSKAGQYLHFVRVEYDWDIVDFPWMIQEREKNLKLFLNDTALKWQEYLKRQRKNRAKP